VAYYGLWVSENGGPFIRIDSLPPNQLTAQIPNLDAEINYSYYIQAEHPDTTFIARSNNLSQTPDIIQGIRQLNAWAANVSANTISIDWQWNDDAELVDAQILPLNSPLGNIDLTALIANIQTDNRFEINTQLTGDQPLSFTIQTIDACDSTFISDTLTTAFISARALPSFENEIQFSAPEVGQAVEITSCEILRYRNNQLEASIPVSPSQTEYSEAFDPLVNPDDEICYQLRCNALVEQLDGTISELSLTSNISCPSREVRLQIPNALSPDGNNPEFRPLFLFQNSITEYQMQIFDRWGQLVFETSEPLQAWRGTINGQQAPPGTYVYRIHIEQRQGDPITKQGTVTLIR
jgi:gliding motility-associated-like protein